jgi:hypothetical protein
MSARRRSSRIPPGRPARQNAVSYAALALALALAVGAADACAPVARRADAPVPPAADATAAAPAAKDAAGASAVAAAPTAPSTEVSTAPAPPPPASLAPSAPAAGVVPFAAPAADVGIELRVGVRARIGRGDVERAGMSAPPRRPIPTGDREQYDRIDDNPFLAAAENRRAPSRSTSTARRMPTCAGSSTPAGVRPPMRCASRSW